MKTIWKYEFKVEDVIELSIPFGGTVLDVQVDVKTRSWGTACIWVLVDTDQPFETRRFRIFGTGNPFDLEDDAGWGYVGTFQELPFVWHLFEDYDSYITREDFEGEIGCG